MQIRRRRHQYIRCTQLCHRTEHLRVSSFLHVIDDVRPELLHRPPGDRRTERVDREDGIRHRFPDDRQGKSQTAHLLLLAGHLSAGACRAGTHIKDSRPFRHHLAGTLADGILRLHTAACEEGVRRYVHNSHDDRAAQVHEPPPHVDGIVNRLYISLKVLFFHIRKGNAKLPYS